MPNPTPQKIHFESNYVLKLSYNTFTFFTYRTFLGGKIVGNYFNYNGLFSININCLLHSSLGQGDFLISFDDHGLVCLGLLSTILIPVINVNTHPIYHTAKDLEQV